MAFEGVAVSATEVVRPSATLMFWLPAKAGFSKPSSVGSP